MAGRKKKDKRKGIVLALPVVEFVNSLQSTFLKRITKISRP